MTKNTRLRVVAILLTLIVCEIAVVIFHHHFHRKTAPTASARPSTSSWPVGAYVYNNVFSGDKLPPTKVDDCGHAVVCGGIHSLSAYQKILKDNPAVAALYASLGIVHEDTVAKDTWAYVTYRVGDKFYWTKKKRLIKAGEKIITDGRGAILMRCGNLFALDLGPGSPTLSQEPSGVYPPVEPDAESPADVIPAPPTDISSPPVETTEEVPPTPPTGAFVPSPPDGVVGTCCFTPTPFTPPLTTTPPVPTPEPSTGPMLLIGLALVVFLGWRL